MLRNFLSSCLVCAFLFSALISQAQDESEKGKYKFKKQLKDAKELIRVEEYHLAEEILLELLEHVPENAEVNYLTGINYLNSNTSSKKKALAYFLKALNNGLNDPKMQFYLGRAEHYNHEFKKAIIYFNTYIGLLDSKEEEEIQTVLHYIEQCRTGLSLMKDSSKVEIFNLGPKVNTDDPEFTPVLSSDENTMLFTSRRDTNLGDEVGPITGKKYEDIYIVKRDKNGEWGDPQNVGAPINTFDHDAVIGLSPEADLLFVYRSDESYYEAISGNIYISPLIAGKWQEPSPLPDGVNTSNWETHATISADEKTLIITSNRDGGLGDKDLYMVRKLPNGEWAYALNLGPSINTPYAEESPFIHPNGKILYFSSKGHNSIGGYDIFYSEYDSETDTWSKAKNMGYPINTADDDVYFSVSPDGQRGYFSSVRDDSYGDQDIYMVSMPTKEINTLIVSGKVVDHESDDPLLAKVSIYDNLKGEKVYEGMSRGGKYTAYLNPGGNYALRVFLDGYMMKSYNLDFTEQKDFSNISRDISLKKVEENQVETLNNIFFTEYNDLKGTSSFEVNDLNKWVVENISDEYVVEVAVHSGYTNSSDSLVNYFATLAKADAIMSFIGTSNDEKGNFIRKGYGFGGKYLLVKGKQNTSNKRNNRLEYIVRKKEDDMSDLNYEELIDGNTLNPMEFVPAPYQGEVVKTSREITFETSSNTLNEENKKVIDEIVMMMMMYPNVSIEVGGHTDSLGKAEFNKLLGLKRAKMISQQLVFEGVEKERIVVKSYGEEEPAHPNNTPEGRRLNRRISFKVMGGGEER